MADAFRKSTTSSSGASNSRFQRRRPASLQISPASAACWNAAIPLLSPLITSPTAVDRTLEVKPRGDQPQQLQQKNQVAEAEKPVVFKKWQHPAAPFNYEPGPFVPSFFVPV